MRVLVVILCLSLLTYVRSEEYKDCTVSATPEFSMKYGEAFAIPEACLLLKCRGGQMFEVVSNCPTKYHGAPSDIATQKSKQMGDLILEGKGCQAENV